jgi:hypothetical protein
MTTDQLFDEFVAAWIAGLRPDVDDFLQRADADGRVDLAERIELWLEFAPTPRYDEPTWDAVRAQPEVAAAVRAMDHPAGVWPSLLPRLRRRAALGLDELAAKITEPLGIAGREAKTAAYLRDLEAGELRPAGVSRRVIDALADALRVSADELVRAGTPRRIAPAGGRALFRATEDPGAAGAQLEALTDALFAPAPAPSAPASPPAESAAAGSPPPDWDEVDVLFRGGA